MSIYNGRDLDYIYYGNLQITEAYYGNKLVYQLIKDPVLVFEKKVNGTYTYTPDKEGRYRIYLVSAGGGGVAIPEQNKYAGKSRRAGGGTGSFAMVDFMLTKESHTITIGKGGNGATAPAYVGNIFTGETGTNSIFQNSSASKQIILAGGAGGTARWPDAGSILIGGDGGTIQTIKGHKEIIQQTNGNVGNTATGWGTLDSTYGPYETYGYGGGAWVGDWMPGSSEGYAGGDGYCAIYYMGKK